MAFHRYLKPKFMILIPLLLALVIAVACGEDETPTPTTAAPTPTATSPAPGVPTATPTPVPPTPTPVPSIPTPTLRPGQPTPTPAPATPNTYISSGEAGTPTKAPVATPTPKPSGPAALRTSTTKTLSAAWGPPIEQPLVPWHSRGLDLHSHHFYEGVIGISRTTGEEDVSQALATSWSVSADGKDFTFQLRKGVKFHEDWGEFTAKDLKHSIDVLLRDDSIARDKSFLEGSSVDIINDYEVVVRQAKGDVFSIPQHFSKKAGASAIYSKAFWDAEGLEGMQDRPIGTNAWSFVSWIPGHEMVAERVLNHWRKTPEFEQYKIQFSAEPATRMAMLLAEEAHMVTVPRDLQKTLIDKGFSLVFSNAPAFAVSWHFGGSHFEFDGLVAAGYDMDAGRSVSYPRVLDEAYYAKSPWTDPVIGKTVREAFNRAVNRDELNDAIYAGQGVPQYVWGMHETVNGWNPRWETEFEEKYGYDLQKAKDLLASVGFNENNKIKIITQTYERFDFPENIAHIEVMAGYFEDTGAIEVDLIPASSSIRNRQQRERVLQGYVAPWFGGFRPYQDTMRPYHAQPAGGATYENVFTWQKYDDLKATFDQPGRAAIISEVGDHMFDNYASIPMHWFTAPALLNAKVVTEYIYPGNIRKATYSHTEYIKAANVK